MKRLDTDASSDAQVPERLIATAIREYGARGTQAISLREIQRKAGVLNEAAVRYYFKNRQGLLDQCLHTVAQRFVPIFDEIWKDLESSVDASKRQPRHVVTAVVVSFYSLWSEQEEAVQLVARMIREEGAEGQCMLLKHFGHVIWRMESALQQLLPQKSAKALRLHCFLAINNIVNGMVDQSLLWQLPAVGEGQGRFQLEQEQLAQGFIEYVSAGLCAASEL